MFTDTIKLAIFDMAGTTVHDNRYVTSALCEALLLHGHDIPIEAADKVMGIAKPVAIKMLLDEFEPEAATETAIEKIHADFLRLMSEFYHHSPEIREIEGTSEVFRSLKQQGIKIGVDTGFSRDITDIIIRRLGWDQEGLIDVSVASDEVPQGRPAPDMIYRAMELSGITDVREVLKVGDTPVDVMEGNNAGCGMVVGVLSGTGTREALLGAGEVTLLSSITELTKTFAPAS